MDKPLRLLIVEDSEDDAILLVRELRRGGYDPTFQRVDTPRAMKAALEEQTWDIVISDYSMPRFSVSEALALLKAKGLDVPFVVVSGNIGEEVAVGTMKAGAHDYLMKNNLKRLVAAVERELRDAEARTKHKRSEEDLKASQEYARDIIDSSLDMIIAVDKNRRITEFNRAAQEIFGYELEEVLGEHVDLLYADTNEGADVHKTTMEKGRLVHEVINKRKNGELFPSLLSASILRDTVGEIVGVMGVSRDITERKQAEEAMQEVGARMRGLVMNLPEGVCLLDADRTLMVVNTAAEEYLELLSDAVRPGDVLSRISNFTFQDLLASCEDRIADEVVLDSPSERFFEVLACPIAKEITEGGYVLLIRDVTEARKIAERAEREYRLATVGQLAAGIAHDFNNLLTVMMGVPQILEMRDDMPDAVKEDLRTIHEQGQRAAQLIRQILDFSRSSDAERQLVNLISFLKETVKLMQRTLPASIGIETEFEEGSYTIEANLTQLQQILTNLAVNARDAMPEGGGLRVGLSSLQLPPRGKPPVPKMDPGDWVVWTVADTGAGMEPSVLKQIYEPFFTTKAAGEGTGLGLAQVYGIVKQYGGHIDVESEVGKGTTFRIYLPRVVEEEVGELEEIDLPKGRGETVLLVEDQEEVMQIAKSMLEVLNYRVLTASDGEQALTAYDQHPGEIDLILTDMVMPKMSGQELATAFQDKDPGVRILVMSGYQVTELIEEQFPESIVGWLEKPMSLDRVAHAVRAALTGDS